MTDNCTYEPLRNGKYTFTIDKHRDLQQDIVSVNLPGVSIAALDHYNGTYIIGNYPGNTTNYDALQITFIVDEKLDNYKKIFNWMHDTVKVNDLTDINSEGVLLIYSGDSGVYQEIVFHKCFPASLSPIDLDQTDEIVKATCTFGYDYFEFVN